MLDSFQTVKIGDRKCLAVINISPSRGAHREVSSLTDPNVRISRSGFLKQDSPGTSRDVESEAAAEDVDEGVRSAPLHSTVHGRGAGRD